MRAPDAAGMLAHYDQLETGFVQCTVQMYEAMVGVVRACRAEGLTYAQAYASFKEGRPPDLDGLTEDGDLPEPTRTLLALAWGLTR